MIICIRMDLALNNLKCLIYHKNQPTNHQIVLCHILDMRGQRGLTLLYSTAPREKAERCKVIAYAWHKADHMEQLMSVELMTQ